MNNVSNNISNSVSHDHYRVLAPLYDLLARWVFRGAIDDAQRALLHRYPDVLSQSQRILWIGGGTGRLLPELIQRAPQAEIIYLDASASMLSRAQARLTPQEQKRITWLCEDYREMMKRNADRSFDVLITAFFLDVLTPHQLSEFTVWATQHIGLWLYADFVPRPQRGAQALVALMYVCFVITTQIKQRTLLDHQKIIQSEGWFPSSGSSHADHSAQSFAWNMIESRGFERL